ncbi:hypothetical protein A2974_03280 [Candidatus Peregrinibacteria bacterium RIFCSPLOWO2_01_FULL_48_20]|nr:MAG: hypothetical protein A2974_03280 [Candidatus Peregrinibacteria bacterium RIFCSPLOWO2_01_FULL_48_20]
MDERWDGKEKRGQSRRNYEDLGAMPAEVVKGINDRLERVLSGNSRREVFSASAEPVLAARAYEIKSRCAAATLHHGPDDVYGRAFTHRDAKDVHQFHFEDALLGDRIQVQSLGFEVTPETYVSAESIREKARSGNLGFEPVATPIMAVDNCVNGVWHGAQMVPSGTVEYHPMARYGQGIFGGNRALRLADGGIGLFRPDMHAARFWRDSKRTMMPRKSDEELIEMFAETTLANAEYLPDPGQGSIYVAPELFAYRRDLGVKPNSGYILACYANPAGSIFKGPARILVERGFHRSVKGGVGDVKVSGNYVGGMPAMERAKAAGFHNVLCLGSDNKFFTETPVSSFFAVTREGILVTPRLDGLILPSVTRDSIIHMAEELQQDGVIDGFEERVIRPFELRFERFCEAFLCGTGATVTPIASITDRVPRHGDVTLKYGEEKTFEMDTSQNGMGWVTARIDALMKEIQAGERNEKGPYAGWIRKIA